jgi:hypothetical protein
VAEPASRRDFVVRLAGAAGVAPAVMAILDGSVQALPRTEETDLAILDAALVLENQAIAIYEAGLKRNLFSRGLRSYAVEFRGDHLGHRETQVAISRERGGRPPEPLARYDEVRAAPGDEMIRAALEIEVAAQRAYTALISQIGTKDYLLSAAFILVDEVRHMTIWRRVLGLRIY